MFASARRALARAMPAPWKASIKRALGMPLTRLHPDWAILAAIGPVETEHVLLDVGAHHGWFFHCWQDWCPQARVIAYEPFPDSYSVMAGLYGNDRRVKLVQAGVGSTSGQMELQVLNESLVSNSFLSPCVPAWDQVGYRHGTITKQMVPIMTIDETFEQEGLDRAYLAKIDVQGFEIKVLKGAERSLDRIDHIFVESGIQQLYEGAPRFSDVFEFLTSRGFHLMAMRSWHRGNQVLVETDMLFRRNELAPPANLAINRCYSGD